MYYVDFSNLNLHKLCFLMPLLSRTVPPFPSFQTCVLSVWNHNRRVKTDVLINRICLGRTIPAIYIATHPTHGSLLYVDWYIRGLCQRTLCLCTWWISWKYICFRIAFAIHPTNYTSMLYVLCGLRLIWHWSVCTCITFKVSDMCI